jgi:hypothetical protein
MDKFQNKNQLDSACWHYVKRWTPETAEALQTADIWRESQQMGQLHDYW